MFLSQNSLGCFPRLQSEAVKVKSSLGIHLAHLTFVEVPLLLPLLRDGSSVFLFFRPWFKINVVVLSQEGS